MIGIMVKLDLTSFAKDGTNTTEVFAVPKSKGDDTIAYAIQVRVAGYHAVVLESQLLIESAAGLRVRVLVVQHQGHVDVVQQSPDRPVRAKSRVVATLRSRCRKTDRRCLFTATRAKRVSRSHCWDSDTFTSRAAMCVPVVPAPKRVPSVPSHTFICVFMVCRMISRKRSLHHHLQAQPKKRNGVDARKRLDWPRSARRKRHASRRSSRRRPPRLPRRARKQQQQRARRLQPKTPRAVDHRACPSRRKKPRKPAALLRRHLSHRHRHRHHRVWRLQPAHRQVVQAADTACRSRRAILRSSRLRSDHRTTIKRRALSRP